MVSEEDGTADIDVPKGVRLTDPHGIVLVSLQQFKCGQKGLETLISIDDTQADQPRPLIVAPLYECARSVRVRDVHPGATVWVKSGGRELLNPYQVAPPEFPIPLWEKLRARSMVKVV